MAKYLDPKANLTFKKISGVHPDLVISMLITLLLFSFFVEAKADGTTAGQSTKRSNVQLNKDGYWNTLFLPFDAEIEGSNFGGATLMELDIESSVDGHVTGLGDDGTLYLNFKRATSVKANKPYIIKWDADDGNSANHSIENLAPRDVTRAASMGITSTDGRVTFCGTFLPITFTEEDKSIILLGEKNTLFWPKPDLTDPSNPVYPSIGAYHAYFKLDFSSGANSVRDFNLNFGDEDTTGVPPLLSAEGGDGASIRGGIVGGWYTLSGTCLSGKPTQKGVYIHGGRKVIVK